MAASPPAPGEAPRGWSPQLEALRSRLEAAEGQLAARALSVATSTWSTLSGNGTDALAEAEEGPPCPELGGAADLHLPAAAAVLMELHPVPQGIVRPAEWLRSSLGRTLLGRGPLSLLPQTRGGALLLVGTRRVELGKGNFALRCGDAPGRYVLSLSEATTLALLLPHATPAAQLAALEAALAEATNLAGDVVLEAAEEAAPPRAASGLAQVLGGTDLLTGVAADLASKRDAAAEVSGVAARITRSGELVSDCVVKGKEARHARARASRHVTPRRWPLAPWWRWARW